MQPVDQRVVVLAIIVSIPIGFSSSLQRPAMVMVVVVTFMFQSLSGFQVRCNPTYEIFAYSRTLGFNPYRVFKFVATRHSLGYDRDDQFQSLSGFQVRCNAALTRPASSSPYPFQSLSGFQVRCNSCAFSSPAWKLAGFNPYRVFKFVATLRFCRRYPSPRVVSIPIGFSSSLQH